MQYNPKSISYWLNRIGGSIILGVIILLTIVLIIPLSPFIALYVVLRSLYRWGMAALGIKYYDEISGYKTKAQHEEEILGKKIAHHEITTEGLPHKTQHPFKEFFSYEDSEYKLPYDVVAFVETEPDAVVDRFLKEDAEWLQQLSAKYGIDLVKADYDKFRQVMVFPQDFAQMKHGFVWRSQYSSFIKEYKLLGNRQYYFELDSNSDKSLREQMEEMMQKIYEVILMC